MFHTELVKSDNQKFSTYWNELAASCELQNPLYNPISAAANSSNKVVLSKLKHSLESTSTVEVLIPGNIEGDFSFVLLENGEPILACSLLLTSDENGQHRLGYRGLGATTYFNRGALGSGSNNISSTSFRALTEHIKRLLCELQPDVVEFQDTLSFGVMSPVSQYLIASGGLPVASTAKLLSLAPSSRSLFREVSKAVRGSVQWGQRNLQLSVRSDNLALYDYLSLYDQIRRDEDNGIAVSLWQSKLDLASLMKAKLGFIVNASYAGRQVGSAVFACRNGVAQYLGCQAVSAVSQKEIVSSLVWKGVTHAKSVGCSELTLDHHFDRQSENLIDFGGFCGESVPRLKVLWRKS